MNVYVLFLYFILTVKCLFALTMIIDLLNFSTKGYFSEEFMHKNHERKERLENLYLFLMAVMIVVIFHNRSQKTKKFLPLEIELLYLLGLVLAFKLFFTWLKRFKRIALKEKMENEGGNNDIIKETIDVTVDVFVPLL